MTREQTRHEIRDRVSCIDYLEKSKAGLYCCPFCGSGKGHNASGALKLYDTNTWTCHACGKSGDVIDLYMLENGTDFNETLFLLAEQIGVSIDTYTPDSTRKQTISKAEAPAKQTEAPEAKDYTSYYSACRENMATPEATEYIQSRGISAATARAYWLGYDPKERRVILPVSSSFYVARAIDAENKIRVKNPKGSSPDIFNIKALYAQEVQKVFVTEGIFDALSVIEAGAEAIATNSTSNIKRLLKELEQRRPEATLILAFDNDERGEEASQLLQAGLQQLNISFVKADVCGEYKDPNEALQKDRASFIKAVERASKAASTRPDNISLYIDTLMGTEIQQFRQDVKTGYKNLDELSGGLYAGLYCIAAISSLGKTTFAAQMADQIAAAGHDVLYFSLEQSRLEMVTKSIARITAQQDINTAVNSLQIRKGYLPKNVVQAAEQYKAGVQDRLSIVEGNFSCNISFIGEYIKQYMQRNKGTKPVVFIDYLQILQPQTLEHGRQQTTKETIDSTITTLKRMSREHGLSVFVISSVNRSNYLTPIDFESLKESGGIEYTCDVIWGLQLQCLNKPIFDKNNNVKERREEIRRAKAATPRKIELVCLKNRYGIANYSAYFDYYPEHDLFQPSNTTELDFETAEPTKVTRRI